MDNQSELNLEEQTIKEKLDFIIQHQDLFQLKQTIDTVLEEQENLEIYEKRQVNSVSLLPRHIMTLAAVGLLFLLPLGYWFYTTTIVPDHVQLANQLHQMPAIQLETIAGIEETGDEIEIAPMPSTNYWVLVQEDYEEEEYQAALEHLNAMLAENPSVKYGYYLRGHIHLQAGDLTAAATDFQDVIDNAIEVKWIKDATWGLGLTYLKAGKKSDAAAIFRELELETKGTLIMRLKEYLQLE